MVSFRRLLIKSFFITIVILASCKYNSQSKEKYSKTFSYALMSENNAYFLMDYRIWTRTRGFWFIMPVEGRTKELFREVYFIVYDKKQHKVKHQKTIRDDFPLRINVINTLFKKENDVLVFAYYYGNDKAELFLVDTGDAYKITYRSIVNRSDEVFHKYFGDYASPWTDNQGVISSSELKNNILKDFQMLK